MTKLITTLAGTLSPNGVHSLRVCPWDQVNTHIDPGSKIHFSFQVRTYGIGSVYATLHDLNESPPSPFNPQKFMNNLDRDIPDSIYLVDFEPADEEQGALIWQEIGTVDEINSPTFQISQDITNTKVFLFQVTNLEPINLMYTVEVYAEIV